MAGTLLEPRGECGERILVGNYKPCSYNLETGVAAGRAKIHPRDWAWHWKTRRLLAYGSSQEEAFAKGAVTVPSSAILDIKVRA